MVWDKTITAYQSDCVNIYLIMPERKASIRICVDVGYNQIKMSFITV